MEEGEIARDTSPSCLPAAETSWGTNPPPFKVGQEGVFLRHKGQIKDERLKRQSLAGAADEGGALAARDPIREIFSPRGGWNGSRASSKRIRKHWPLDG